ncbi:MAG TPA: 2-oxoglutarate dehydrogenase E1 component [Myxococcota bacterium]|nr:2-oxoglutarate dehydrogenase E1 component [Myxococcota bacterium]
MSEELEGLFSGENGAWVEALYQDYVLGRERVPDSWRAVFDRIQGRAPSAAPAAVPATRANGRDASAPLAVANSASDAAKELTEDSIVGLVDAWRSHGHLVARLDPLGNNRSEHPLLDPAMYGLASFDPSRRVKFGSYLAKPEGTLPELQASLRRSYGGTFGAEFMEIRDKPRRDWLLERMEPRENRPVLSTEERLRTLTQVISAERFEQFLHKRFLGVYRFSLEGGESLIPIMDTLVEGASELGAEEIVIAMAHRGRLNLMAHTMDMPYRAIMAEFQATLMPSNAQGAGDVKYHRGYSADRRTRAGKSLHLSLCPNPSHLEWINPVAEGVVAAKQHRRGDAEGSQVVPVQIHGDAAFTGQGIVYETLALSELATYRTGGTVHVIIDNQIGFTTEPSEFRFTQYPSDTAKNIQAPIFHVNADDPEACVHAAKLAIAFRQQFKEDVIIHLVCYRRHGHNEGDDPTYTQPLMYKAINAHERVAQIYTDRLLAENVIDAAALAKLEDQQKRKLEQALEESTTHTRLAGAEGYHGLWEGLANPEQLDGKTAVTREVLESVARALVEVPAGFSVHPKLRRQLEQRQRSVLENEPMDWGTAEALAIGTLLAEGIPVRLTGQDCERGTFGHRHAVLHDVENGARYISLDKLGTSGARFEIANSLLSEAAVLGFEYGYSTVDPNRLAMWEAQFGDFANSAQVIIDQFIASGEKKWSRSSGLVMLLPHGYEGKGPEHSSARLERFLQLCAEDNLQVVNLTSPAQYFHALRRQIRRNFRKPLVVMSPKSLLRSPKCVSLRDELSSGEFREVLDDPTFGPGGRSPQSARRVLISSGKVYYTLLEAREDSGFEDVPIVRLEQLHPFPFESLMAALGRYGASEIAWVQEEPWNMGGWNFVSERLRRVLPADKSLRYVGRRESASPATGSYRLHEEEQAEFVREAFAAKPMARREG